jgi:hypothetical protein
MRRGKVFSPSEQESVSLVRRKIKGFLRESSFEGRERERERRCALQSHDLRYRIALSIREEATFGKDSFKKNNYTKILRRRMTVSSVG